MNRLITVERTQMDEAMWTGFRIFALPFAAIIKAVFLFAEALCEIAIIIHEQVLRPLHRKLDDAITDLKER